MSRRLPVGILCLSLASSAFAAPNEASQEFRKASKAFQAGDFRAAAEGFERAYKLKPHPDPLWNAAQAWDKSQEPVRAANLLEQYLQEAPPGAKDRDKAIAALKDLKTRIGRIEARGMGVTDLKVDDTPVKDGVSIYVTPGEHAASGDASGTAVRKTVSVEPGQVLSVTLEPPPPPPVAPIIIEKPKGLPVWVVIAAGGATLATTGVTVWSGLNTLSLRDEFRAGGETNEPLYNEAKSAQFRTNIFLGVSIGLAAVTGAIAVLTDWKSLKSQSAPSKGALPGTVVRW